MKFPKWRDRVTFVLRRLAALICGALWLNPLCAQVNVLTYHNDFARTGQNTNETTLTTALVNSSTFGKLFSYAVDGHVYAQPLYISGLAIPGKGTHNVVFVVTQHNGVYAFDADGGGLLWQVSMGPSSLMPNNDFGNRYGPYHDIVPEVGITSTPVIDLTSGTMYLDAFTHEGPSYLHRVHALDIATGAERPFSPVVVNVSVPGNGVGSSAGRVPLTPTQHLQRPALTLAGGILYIAYSGYADTNPYHGWVVGFDPATLQQLTNHIFNTTPNSTTAAYGPNAGEGGIWMAGNGLAVDAATNLYFMVGNGVFNATNAGATEYGDCFVKLSTAGGLSVADWFAPFNQGTLANNDTDLGSGGSVLLPDSVGSVAHPRLIVGAGKEGKLYLLDRDNLGHFNAGSDSQIVQSVPGAVGGVFSTPAYFNQRLYFQGSGDVMKAFAITNGTLSTTPISRSSTSFGFPGATPSVSANGTNNAIVWILQSDAAASGGPAVLRAFNAYNLTNALYNSSQAGIRDRCAGAVKTAVPTIANGKVYVGGQFALTVFGTGTFLAVPTITPAGGFFTNSVTVTLADSTPGTTIYYTLDNSIPSTNSLVYSAPLLLTNTAAVRILAFKPGAVASPVVSATFINSASISFSQGFLKQEFYSGATRANLENPAYTNSPAFVQYLTSFESPSGQGNNYTERLSGYFIPSQTTNYVFFLCADDDSDLFLSTDSSPANKHLIAAETVWSNSRQWVSSGGGSVLASKRSDQFAGTTWPGGNTIQLTAGIQYYIEAVHHQGSGGDNLAVTFKFAAAPDPINGDAPRLFGNLVAVYAYNNTFINITSPPQSVLRVEGTTASFSVGAISGYLGGSSSQSLPILYQWQSAPQGSVLFTNIPGATSSSYGTLPLILADDGRQFQVSLSTAGTAINSPAAKLTVVHDTTPPLPVQVVSVNSSGTVFVLQFTEPLAAASAQASVNYLFTPGNINAANAVLDPAGTKVTLTTGTSLPAATPITLMITAVQDLHGNPVPPGTSITFSFTAQGAVSNGAITPATLRFTSIDIAEGQAVLQWMRNGTLEEATNVAGPWITSPNQSNPQSALVSGTKFYRLRQ
jgi:hypothetical protein